MSDIRASELEKGMVYREFGEDDTVTIEKIGMWGDTMLITTDDGVETTLDRDEVVDLVAAHAKPVPDFVLDTHGEYSGNAYPETQEYRVAITVLGTGEDFGLTVENTSGGVVGSATISLDEADGIAKVATTDHSLSVYDDDWTIPAGIERTVRWTLPTDGDVSVHLDENDIGMIRDWLEYATGEKTWNWEEQGNEWE